jgi:serine phosphatase RsbU (regulator of sigma subunit)
MDGVKNTRHSGSSLIEWGAAGRPLEEPGEGYASGDVHVVAPFQEGVLVGLIDGLGHGFEAAIAAQAAADVLSAHAGEPVQALIQRCHERLRKTRGAVMSLASFDQAKSSMTWIGVGNVEGVLLRAFPSADSRHESTSTRGGIVGYQLPPLRAYTVSISQGDTVILATDGIESGFSDGVNLQRGPQEIADSILAMYAKGSDDSLVVVARYLGGSL